MTREEVIEVLENSIFVKNKYGAYCFGLSRIYVEDDHLEYEFYNECDEICCGCCDFNRIQKEKFSIESLYDEDTTEIFVNYLGDLDHVFLVKWEKGMKNPLFFKIIVDNKSGMW